MTDDERARWGPFLPDLYDGEVRYTDDYFGRFVDRLGELGLLDETLVVLTASAGAQPAGVDSRLLSQALANIGSGYSALPAAAPASI